MNNIIISCFKYSSNRAHKFDVAKNYYQTLQLKSNCTKAAIRNSYLSLAKKYHPDINAHGKQKFTCIQEAYQILSNEQDRKQYDVFYNTHINPQPKVQKPYSKPYVKDQGPFKYYTSQNQHSTYNYGGNTRHHHAYQEFKGKKTHYQTNKQDYEEYDEEEYENPQRKNTRTNKQQYSNEAFEQWAKLKKKRQEWAKQFYENSQQPYNSYKTYKKPKTHEQQQFLKMQHAFSSRNPFAPPKNQPDHSKTDVIKQLGLDQYWQKIKGKFWK